MKNIFNRPYSKKIQFALCTATIVLLSGATVGMRYTLGKLHKYKKQAVALEYMQKLSNQSDSIVNAGNEKIAWLNDELSIIQHIENKAVADSLVADREHKKAEVLQHTQKSIERNIAAIQAIAVAYDIKLR